MYQYINLASVIVVLLVIYFALQNFSPIVPIERGQDSDKDRLREKYHRFTRQLLVGLMLVWVLLTIAMNWLLDALITFRLSFLYDVLYIVPPNQRIVLFNATCIAFLLSFLLFWRIAYFKALTSWEEYQQFISLYFRFDLVHFSRHFTRVLTLFTILLTILVFDWYTTFGDQEIKANDLLGLGTRKYEYNSIVEVKNVKKRENLLGDLIDQPFCVMTFQDQYKWKNLLIGDDEHQKILDLVMARTNVNKQERERE